jgi:putative hydrolase of the HAD superfamily
MQDPPVAVVFDLDETLAVTARDRQTLLDEATDAVGTARIDRTAYLEAHGTVEATQTREPIFEALLAERAADADAAALATAYREAIETALEPLSGAADLVRTLRESYRVGLLTDGPLVAQRGKLRELGWTDLFETVVITGSLPAGKPAADAFVTVCDALGVTPAETVYVGDRPEVDVAGAAAAGCRTVQVRYASGPDRHPAADAVVERPQLVERLPAVLAECYD